MSYPKFILTSEGHIRLGMVHLHRELLQSGDHCLGGGFYRFDYTRQWLILEHQSMDYGAPQWDAVDALTLPADYMGFSPIYRRTDGSFIKLYEEKTIGYD